MATSPMVHGVHAAELSHSSRMCQVAGSEEGFCTALLLSRISSGFDGFDYLHMYTRFALISTIPDLVVRSHMLARSKLLFAITPDS